MTCIIKKIALRQTISTPGRTTFGRPNCHTHLLAGQSASTGTEHNMVIFDLYFTDFQHEFIHTA